MDRNRYLPVEIQNDSHVNSRSRNISNRKTLAEILFQIGNSILQMAFIAILIFLLIVFSMKLGRAGIKFEKSENQSASEISKSVGEENEFCKILWREPNNRHICRHPDKIEIINID